MKSKKIIEKIKEAAKQDEKNRKDPRFKRAMAFLIKKGFLKSNVDYHEYYRAKMDLSDLIWAGKTVEPRILEVLPAAAARLPRAFRQTSGAEFELLNHVVKDLRQKVLKGHDFLGVPYDKLKVWMDLPLMDKRTKANFEKKRLATFRLREETIAKIKLIASKNAISEASVIENLIQQNVLT